MRFLIRLWPALAGLLLAGALLALLQAGSAQAITRSLVHTTVADFDDGTFYRSGLTQQGNGEVTLLNIGIAGEWITTTNTTNFVPRSGHAAILANERLYVFGGRTAGSTLTSIQYATINTTTHNLSDWSTAAISLGNIYSNGISSLSAATLNGYVYLLGGYSSSEDAAGITSTVAFAQLQSDGSLTAFGRTAPLPQPLSRGEAVVLNGRIYLLGGRGADSQGRASVYYAQPDAATGVIPQWFTATAALPQAVFGHEALTANGKLYIVGGFLSNSFQAVADVYVATPATDTGDIAGGGWIATEVMPFPLYEAAAASFAGQLYSTGGIANASIAVTPSNYVRSALPEDTGVISAWVNSSLIYPARFAHAAVVNTDGWIYLIGGTVGSNQPITTSIVNAGATAGTGGSAYAQFGRYTSAIVDLKKNHTLQELKWTAYLNDTSSVALTLRYRYRPKTGSWSDWLGTPGSASGAGTTTSTHPLTPTARYFQYAALFTSTTGLTTPILSQVELIYDQPEPPQFLKLSDPPGGTSVRSGERITYTLRYSNTSDRTVFHNILISDPVPANTNYLSGSIFAAPAVAMTVTDNSLLTWEISELQPHTGGELGFVVTVAQEAPQGVQIQNSADLTSDEIDTRSPLVVHTLGTPPILIKSAGTSAPGQAGTSVQPGDRITYTLFYSNPNSAQTLTNVVITDVLPAHLSYLSAFGTITNPTLSNGKLRWSVGTLPPLVSGTLGFVASVSNTAPNGSSIVNTAQIDSNETSAISSNTTTNAVKYRFDLALTQTDGRITAAAGERLTYTLRITNTATYPTTATGILITDYLEPGLPGLTATVLSYVGGTPGWAFAETDADGNAVYEYALGALGPNQSRSITLAVQITGALPAGVLAVRNSAEAADDGLNGIEIDPSNQLASDTDIVAGPDLAVTGIRLINRSGLQATVVVSITNQGFEAANNFGSDLYVKSVGGPPPWGPGDRYLGICPTPGNYCPGSARWSLYNYTDTSMAPGQTKTLTYTHTFPSKGVYWLYTQADLFWGQGADPDPTHGSSQNGRIIEGDEANNIYGPVLLDLSDYKVFVPVILKNK